MDERTARAELAQGHSLYGQGRWEAAAAAFTRLINSPHLEIRAQALHGLGATCLHSRDCGRARAAYQELLYDNEGDAEARYGLALALILEGEAPTALGHLQKALLGKPHDQRIWAQRGSVELMLGHAQEAVVSYQRCLQIDAGDELVWTNLGCALALLGRMEQAESCWHRALEIAPGYGPALQHLGHSEPPAVQVSQGCLAADVGLLLVNGFSVFLKGGSPLPTSYSRNFVTALDNQRYLPLRLCQASRPPVELGYWNIGPLPPGRAQETQVTAEFAADTVGRLSVRAFDERGGEVPVRWSRTEP